eukprot:SAG31_NODE_16601_length_703_cov_0.649007_2_plen_151_part_01
MHASDLAFIFESARCFVAPVAPPQLLCACVAFQRTGEHDGQPAEASLLTTQIKRVEADADAGICCHCNKRDNPTRMVICDGCNTGHHTYCITPTLHAVPNGPWYCNGCSGEYIGIGSRKPVVWGWERLPSSIFASDVVRQAMKYRTWQRED